MLFTQFRRCCLCRKCRKSQDGSENDLVRGRSVLDFFLIIAGTVGFPHQRAQLRSRYVGVAEVVVGHQWGKHSLAGKAGARDGGISQEVGRRQTTAEIRRAELG